MFKGLIDRMKYTWQGRFKHGMGLNLGDITFTRFDNGEVLLVVHVGTVASNGTGHWPWYVLEFGACTGPRSAWHVGLIGFTVGKVVVNDYDQETGEIVGPDKAKYYWFFKGLNHQNKQLEEII